jgi:hypothetical protein
MREWSVVADLSGDAALEATQDLALLRPSMVRRWTLLAARSPLRLSRCRPVMRPPPAGGGATPQSLAKAASLWMRSALSPAVTRNCPAISMSSPRSSPGRSGSRECLDLLVEEFDLVVESLPASDQVTQCGLDSHQEQPFAVARQGQQIIGFGRQPRTSVDQGPFGERDQVVAQR